MRTGSSRERPRAHGRTRSIQPERRVFRPGLQRARAIKILDILADTHPDATCALHHQNPYELLTATILSAQCTDERVNQVTPELFRRYPDAAALSRATTTELEPQIQSTGFFK